ncbi:hypothetical protein AB0E69_05885 [Kribbella sp. NPDC026611]|uniref:hypothetical protein n=1 Tax=Kribbella sp. NPDC026611 TaxID=3154911 RepID=UPI0033EF57FE
MTWRFWRWRRTQSDQTGRCRTCMDRLETCANPGHNRIDYVHCFLQLSCPTHGRHWY